MDIQIEDVKFILKACPEILCYNHGVKMRTVQGFVFFLSSNFSCLEVTIENMKSEI